MKAAATTTSAEPTDRKAYVRAIHSRCCTQAGQPYAQTRWRRTTDREGSQDTEGLIAGHYSVHDSKDDGEGGEFIFVICVFRHEPIGGRKERVEAHSPCLSLHCGRPQSTPVRGVTICRYEVAKTLTHLDAARTVVETMVERRSLGTTHPTNDHTAQKNATTRDKHRVNLVALTRHKDGAHCFPLQAADYTRMRAA